MKIVLLTLLAFYPMAHSFYVGYLLETEEMLTWARPTRNPDLYQVLIDRNDPTKMKIIERKKISFISKTPVNGIGYGWLLYYNPSSKTYEHCRASEIFEDGRIHTYCNLYDESKQNSYRVEYPSATHPQIKSVQNYIPEVSKLSDLTAGMLVRSLKNYKLLKKNSRYKIRALFLNGTALVLKDNLETRLRSGPYYDSISVVVPISIISP